ncbi:hypothetical protein XELAEV_18025812mg [Xenopus laevis]|uniref:Uncharacterized protein n=1 Tax=Xenopus laevis TaxID=8355 RepID=A0A974D2D9_XENLA|nr:hypothetical protein XELAEV_18025812mg [Xenopus laevis]
MVEGTVGNQENMSGSLQCTLNSIKTKDYCWNPLDSPKIVHILSQNIFKNCPILHIKHQTGTQKNVKSIYGNHG